MLFFIVLPMTGLAIDVGILYAVKAKLQTASDGAALAAARSLSRGISLTQQQASAAETAERFFAANIEDGWMGIVNSDIDVTFPTGPPRTAIVNVNASTQAPTYFMRLFGYTFLPVRGLGQASRRDVNIMMVLDRSRSLALSSSCDDLRNSARFFVQSFVDGRDRMGLVTYGTSYRTDFNMAFDFQSRSSGNMVNLVNNINCIGGTNSAAAYWTGYQRLVDVNDKGALNVILFFTDGQPNAVHVNNLQVLATSPCTDKSNKEGVVTPNSGMTKVLGLFRAIQPNAPPVGSSGEDVFASGTSNCTFRDTTDAGDDLVGYPASDQDVFGNSLASGYRYVERNGAGRISLKHPQTATNVGINALDDAARRVRVDSAIRDLDVVTYSIGLSNTVGAAEDELLRRVSNAPESPIYNSTLPTGMYIRAENETQLLQAFATIASEILRVSM